MNRKSPKYNPDTKKASYPFSVHHSETKGSSRPKGLFVSGPDLEFQSNLADSYGMDFALRSLQDRYKK